MRPTRLALLAACAFLASCENLTGPTGGIRGGLSSSDVVAITASGSSTTGVPVLALPTSHDGGEFLISSMSAINGQNWVVGTGIASSGREDAVLWRGGAAFERPLGTRAQSSSGLGLGENGMVVGQIRFTPWSGFRWEDGAGPAFLPNPPLLASGIDWDARDVDADGNILVVYRRTNTGCSNTAASAVFRPPFGTTSYEVVPPLECLNSLSGFAIDDGAVVGQVSTPPSAGGANEAFRWDGGSAIDLIGGGAATALSGDYAAGRTFLADEALRWTGGSAPEPLGTLGGATSTAHGVNRLGWVVGQSLTATGETHAFLWTPGDGMTDLGTLGGANSYAKDVNDAGYIVGDAERADGRRVPVVWIMAVANEPPDIDPIGDRYVTVGEALVVEPVVTDPEGDPFSLVWSGDVPENATLNGSLSWTPTADQVGDHTITVTATQDDDPSLFDSETFVISVLPEAAPSADLRVTVGPASAGQRFLGDAVAYLATVYNAGPDAAPVGLTVALEFRDQAAWGDVPPAAAINGIFFLDLGLVDPGTTVDVPFEVLYGAFGVQAVTATLAGSFDELAPADNTAAYDQVIDLALDTPGVETGGLDVPGAFTSDGLGLAVVGVRIPGALIAGEPDWDLFLPAGLTDPAPSMALQSALITGASFTSGGQFIPGVAFVSGQVAPPDIGGIPATPGAFVPDRDDWLPGRAFIPAVHEWDPAGRLLFARGMTRVRVGGRAGTSLTLKPGQGPGMAIDASGGTADADLGLCGDSFSALMGGGDGAEFACGSLTTMTLTGEVGILLADGTRVDVPAGATAVITEREGGYEISAAGAPIVVTSGGGSFSVAAGETVFVGPPQAELQGCGTGFWKSRSDLARFPTGWPPTGYGPDDLVENAFGVSLEGSDLTLSGALRARGGGLNALLRQATAALLNAAHPGIAYGLDPGVVRERFADAVSSGTHASAKNDFESFNEKGCPINGK